MENLRERTIEKIRKVLELSRNNPSEEEAKSAMLKAQRLMAEYDVTMKEVEAEDESDNIVSSTVEVGMGNKWKYMLANLIAKNFRCRFFTRGKAKMVFYGYETDAEIASMTFKYLFTVGNRASTNYYNRLKKEEGVCFDGSGVRNSYLIGFVEGIKVSLEAQSTALMVITPQEVNEAFENLRKGFKSSHNRLSASSQYASQARTEGFQKGKDIMARKNLERKQA